MFVYKIVEKDACFSFDNEIRFSGSAPVDIDDSKNHKSKITNHKSNQIQRIRLSGPKAAPTLLLGSVPQTLSLNLTWREGFGT